MSERLFDIVTATAMESMLFEVSATPKPGLVTPYSNGAHRDMDYYTFLSSAAALHRCFDEMLRLGVTYSARPVTEVLPPLRVCGIKQEEMMFTFTKGINTHKGMIFSMGILCACYGWGYGKEAMSAGYLGRLAAAMCAGICDREFQGLKDKQNLTKGEQMYVRYGFRGARGEAESGFETVRRISLPVYRELRKQKISVNDALVQTLLHLIAGTNDTNIISRHDYETSVYAGECAAKAILAGGILTAEGKRCIKDMELDFIRRNISPGGCADLLAVTHFLYQIDGE